MLFFYLMRSENEGSAGSRVNIHQKLQEKKQKQLAELKIIEEEIKQGKLGGPNGLNNLHLSDDNRQSLPRQPIPRVKKHINIDPNSWRSSSPDQSCHLNDLIASNIDDVNNHSNKFARSYDPLYNSFALNNFGSTIEANQCNRSPIPSTNENASIMRSIVPRTKIPHHAPPNPFGDSYRSNFGNIYETYETLPVNGGDQTTNNGLYMNAQQTNDTENLPFHYNMIPPPRNKIDSRLNDVMQEQQTQQPQQQQQQPQVSQQQQQRNVSTSRNLLKIETINANQLKQHQRINMHRQFQRAKTPEILLSPHYLDNSRIYYDWMARETNERGENQSQPYQIVSSGDENIDDPNDDGKYRDPSDIDSQVS